MPDELTLWKRLQNWAFNRWIIVAGLAIGAVLIYAADLKKAVRELTPRTPDPAPTLKVNDDNCKFLLFNPLVHNESRGGFGRDSVRLELQPLEWVDVPADGKSAVVIIKNYDAGRTYGGYLKWLHSGMSDHSEKLELTLSAAKFYVWNERSKSVEAMTDNEGARALRLVGLTVSPCSEYPAGLSAR